MALSQKRVWLSGYAYKKQRKWRKIEEEKLTGSLDQILVKKKKLEIENECQVSENDFDRNEKEEKIQSKEQKSNKEDNNERTADVIEESDFKGVKEEAEHLYPALLRCHDAMDFEFTLLVEVDTFSL